MLYVCVCGVDNSDFVCPDQQPEVNDSCLVKEMRRRSDWAEIEKKRWEEDNMWEVQQETKGKLFSPLTLSQGLWGETLSSHESL